MAKVSFPNGWSSTSCNGPGGHPKSCLVSTPPLLWLACLDRPLMWRANKQQASHAATCVERPCSPAYFPCFLCGKRAEAVKFVLGV